MEIYYSGFLLIKNLSSDFNSLNGVFIITLTLLDPKGKKK